MISLVAALAGNARAAEVGFTGYVGYLATSSDEIGSDLTGGGRLRARFVDRFALEASVGGVPEALDPRLEADFFLAPISSRLNPFVAVGGGGMVGSEWAYPLVDAGLGLDINLMKYLDLRADGRFRAIVADEFVPGAHLSIGVMVHTARVTDADGDGVSDGDDRCEDVPEDLDGFEDADGCPDTDDDADGVLDTADTCRTEKEDADGFEDADGCPDTDDDKDGVADTADKCPRDAEDEDGFEDEDGCAELDNDQDGVPDGKDKAPNEPETMNGYQDGDGAPDEVPAAVAKFSGRIEGITFDTGKATIAKSSFATLEEAAKVLTEFPDVRLEVQGHTDDQGVDEANLKLSQARAEAVVAWLVQHGVAADRLVAKGYGETKPLVPNDSSAHRAQNRRVEFQRLP